MPGYYDRKLAAERLRRCYELATPAVRRYLAAEAAFVRGRLAPDDVALELGCGFGRALAELAPAVRRLWGVDTSLPSLHLARGELAAAGVSCPLAAMDAARLAFRDGAFDAVIAIQNGLSAFHRDPLGLVREALRVTRPGGIALFSSYAERFWPQRLEWFERQAAAGLLGEIDRERTGAGAIVCRDGFRASTFGVDDFRRLAAEAAGAGLAESGEEIAEVDGSSLFLVLRKRAG